MGSKFRGEKRKEEAWEIDLRFRGRAGTAQWFFVFWSKELGNRIHEYILKLISGTDFSQENEVRLGSGISFKLNLH